MLGYATIVLHKVKEQAAAEQPHATGNVKADSEPAWCCTAQ